MIQNVLYTSYDNAEIDENVFHDDPFCNVRMIIQLCLITTYKTTKLGDIHCQLPQKNFSLKNHIMKQDRQKIKILTRFLKHLIFPTLLLIMTLLSHSLTNQTPFCTSTSYKPITGILEPKKIYDRYREETVDFSIPHLPLRINDTSHES